MRTCVHCGRWLIESQRSLPRGDSFAPLQLLWATIGVDVVRPRMNPISAAATDAASSVWTDRVGDDQSATATATATIDLLHGLRIGLGRWIGVAGYETLLDRAVGIAREDFPWISVLFQPEMEPSDIVAAVESFGTPVVVAGGKKLLAVMIELLGRIVGIDMAVHLVKHIGTSSRGPAISAATEDKLDD